MCPAGASGLDLLSEACKLGDLDVEGGDDAADGAPRRVASGLDVAEPCRVDWAIVVRFAVWCVFMASGIVVIPLSIAMSIAYFPAGVPAFLTWLDWLEGIHTWMLGSTSRLGEPISPSSRPVQSEGIDPVQSGHYLNEITHAQSRVCPICGYDRMSASGMPELHPLVRHRADGWPTIVARASNS
jgi:hypothetical protein